MIYKYITVSGTEQIEISDEWGKILKELDRNEYNNNHTETRRHSTLDNDVDDAEWLLNEDKNLCRLLGYNINAERVRETLSKMKPQQREILISIYVEGVTQQEYAKKLGINQSNVSRRLATAKKSFCKIFSKTA
ncbi:MAG: sigma-70 family RNA polymerase sigma factor [Eubacterium sp.]|nr:sigma-70 family RNA polymerase sigma factor [Eubacterium sp.]